MNIKQLILMGTLLISSFTFSMTPGEQLLYASEKDNLQGVQEALTNSANVNITDKDGWTGLIYAARNNHKDIAEFLIAKGADVNIKNGLGETALMEASLYGHKEMAKLLLANKADLNPQSNYGFTALAYAAWNGHSDIVELLINNDADVNAKNIHGDTALLWAAVNKRGAMVELLVLAGADLTALEMCPKYYRLAQEVQEKIKELSQALDTNDGVKVIRVLKETPVVLCIKDEEGNTLLAKAVMRGNTNMAVILANFYTNALTIKNKAGLTPIHLAAIYKQDFLALIVSAAFGQSINNSGTVSSYEV